MIAVVLLLTGCSDSGSDVVGGPASSTSAASVSCASEPWSASTDRTAVALWCDSLASVVMAPREITGATPAARIESRFLTLSTLSNDERSAGLYAPWQGPLATKVIVDGNGRTVVDMPPPHTVGVQSTSSSGRAFIFVLWGTIFNEPSVTQASITVDGDAEAMARYFQSVGPTTMTRGEWEKVKKPPTK